MRRLGLAALALVLLLGAATAAAAPGNGKGGGKQDTAATKPAGGKPDEGTKGKAGGKPTGPIASGHTATGNGGLEPGELTQFTEEVPVNIVYVGINPADEGAFSETVGAAVPASYAPIMRYPAFYGGDGTLGITYTYDVNQVFAPQDWEAAFFTWLDAQKETQESVDGNVRSLFQQQYNDQATNSRDVGSNHFIDAPDVERYLIDHGAALGIDTREPTIFYIDWYRAAATAGVPAFVDHTYVKMGEVDPETGYDFGLLRQSRKINAWGGTAPDDKQPVYSGDPRRVWFYDLSAGPQSWGENWNVDDADLDGDGDGDGTEEPDYRIPPSWEYDDAATPADEMAYEHPGYPGAASLATDLGKVTRWVGLHLLFTTSPLYAPYFNANDLPETVQLDVNTVEGWNQIDASPDWIDEELFLEKEKALPTGFNTELTAEYQDIKYDGDWNRCYKQFVADKVCYNDLHPDYASFGGFVNPFLLAARHQDELLDRDADYEATLVNFAIGSKPKGAGLLGFADDNWLNGTQSGVFSFVYPEVAAVGYGLTTTMIHEYGHHSSMSHPHDGWDGAVDFGPGDEYMFAWQGDLSNSIMSYIDLNWDFSQFDRDNSARHHAAGYAKIANRIAADVLDDPDASDPTVDAALDSANTHLTAAQTAFGAHEYLDALAAAKAAYWEVREAADEAGVAVVRQQPSTFTIVGPVKPGNGPGKKTAPAYARDTHERTNVNRVFSK